RRRHVDRDRGGRGHALGHRHPPHQRARRRRCGPRHAHPHRLHPQRQDMPMSRDTADMRGFTVVELTVTCAVLSLVLVSLLSLLDSQTRAERHLQAVVNSQEDVRFAMLAIARDVRAADPLLPLSSVDGYANQIQLQLRDGSGTSLGYVRWILDPAAQAVSRLVLSGPNGTVTSTVFTLPRVRNAQDGLPLFR